MNFHPDLKNQIWRVINFVIFLAVIYYAGGKKLFTFFPGRSKEIESELNDLAARRENAEQKLADVEKSIANLEEERAKLIEQAKAQGEALKSEIIAKAETAAELIKQQARVSAEQEAKLALEEIKAELAEQVTEAAEAMIRKKLKAEDHKALINDSLTRVVLN
ncbi:MAG: F0F1 ATP synthase subunit B [Desulfonatronovibrio sp. MSAO_Bac4]|nr:MAG: F0F1 ATP synthase subunit B [Desulfonatronovibrio sp. MSAO_Bac4]